MAKKILLIHGRHFKPPKADLRKLWLDAIRHGIKRDHPDKLEAFDRATVELVYYGDISNDYLLSKSYKPDPNDLADRRKTLAELKTYRRNQFTRAKYRKLPGYNPWMEGLADAFGGISSLLRFSEPLIEKIAPDVSEYWSSLRFGSQVRAVFTAAIIKAMKNPGEICVIAHSLGTMISYDVFWKLSHYGEYWNQNWNREISSWITLGAPLADETVRRKLKGAGNSGRDRYPTNVKNWLNLAAEDDYISHDQKVADDFRPMKKLGCVESIVDKRIYNLAVRGEKSNPHHGAGYLIHPAVADAVAGWV
jgi:hypothetical protein